MYNINRITCARLVEKYWQCGKLLTGFMLLTQCWYNINAENLPWQFWIFIKSTQYVHVDSDGDFLWKMSTDSKNMVLIDASASKNQPGK